MNRIQWKDFFREIHRNKGRFFSLLFIVALGCAFYSGIRSSEPDMTASANQYYTDTNFCDIRLISTLGLTDDDVQAVASIEGVVDCEGAYSTELFAKGIEDEPIISVVSLSDKLNQFTIRQGRLPENDRECFVDVAYMNHMGCSIGDSITFLDADKEAPDILKRDSYTIVGYGTWAWYLNLTRGSAAIGDGKVDAFAVLHPTAFDQDFYTTIYATVAGAHDVNCYSEDYDNIVQAVMDRIENIAEIQVQARHDSIVAEGQEKLDDARSEIADAKQELADAYDQLNDGEKTYSDGKKEYEDGLAKYESGKKDYEKGLAAYEKGQAAFESGVREYEAGKAEYDKGLAQYQEGARALEEGRAQLEAGRKELDDGWQEYEQGLKESEEGAALIAENEQMILDGEAQIAEAEAQIEAGEKEAAARRQQLIQLQNFTISSKARLEERLQALEETEITEENEARIEREKRGLHLAINLADLALEQYDGLLAQIAAGEEEIAAGKAELAAKKEELEAGKAELAAAKEQLAEGQAQLAAAKEQLEAGEAEYSAGMEELTANEAVLADARKVLDDSAGQLAAAKQQIDSGRRELNASASQIASAADTLAAGKKELDDAKTELADGRKELDDGWEEYYSAKEEADVKIADAELEIADGQKTLDELDPGKWYVLNRDTIQTAVEYGMDAERIGKIATVFPVIFFLVAALVSLTTMTRMIEEERMLIGTMKALGYSKFAIISKYLVYAGSATLAGGLLGVLLGSKILPYVIMTAYGMLYTNVPYRLTPYHLSYCLISIGMAMLCTVGAAFAACYRELLSTPASLMRPPAPKHGKKIFLEYLPFIWERLNFSLKSTIRNLIRYKKRLFMTIFGIGGCMAILLVSYGLHDAISAIVDNQYQRIWTYSASCNIDDKWSLEQKEALRDSVVGQMEHVEEAMLAKSLSLDVSTAAASKNTYLYVVENTDKMKSFVSLHDRITKEEHELTDEGVIVSEKLARMLEVGPGDEMMLKLSDSDYRSVRITDTAENYLFNYIYLTPKLYEEVYGEEPDFNELMIRYDQPLEEEEEDATAEELMKMEGISSISLVTGLQHNVNNMLNALNLVVWVLVVAAGLLVFVVTYNLNNINISERRRELASLKVLGFYDMEVAMYVYRENIFLTIFGIIAGLFMGTWLHHYVITTLEVEMIMFGRDISLQSYIYSSLLTVVFSVFVNLMMYYRLRQIDMVESLKSVE